MFKVFLFNLLPFWLVVSEHFKKALFHINLAQGINKNMIFTLKWHIETTTFSGVKCQHPIKLLIVKNIFILLFSEHSHFSLFTTFKDVNINALLKKYFLLERVNDWYQDTNTIHWRSVFTVWKVIENERCCWQCFIMMIFYNKAKIWIVTFLPSDRKKIFCISNIKFEVQISQYHPFYQRHLGGCFHKPINFNDSSNHQKILMGVEG